jgi:hypothetical protein
MKIEIDNKLLGTAASAAALASLLTAGTMYMTEKPSKDPSDYIEAISGAEESGTAEGSGNVEELEALTIYMEPPDSKLPPVDMAKLCKDPNVMGYVDRNDKMIMCPLQTSAKPHPASYLGGGVIEIPKIPTIPLVSLASYSPNNLASYSPNTVYRVTGMDSSLTQPVRWAIGKYGRMLLTYELGNDGKLGDRELVISVLARRLAYVASKHPTWTSKQLMESVAKRWNPNKDKNLKQIQARVKRNRKCGFSCKATNKQAVENILAGRLATKIGRTAWANKYTDFAHLDKAPSYYKKLASSKYHPADSELKYRVWTGHNKAYFYWFDHQHTG